MKIAILTANLGNFDLSPIDPVTQVTQSSDNIVSFHRFTDNDFPSIAGLTPRLQYRIPKLFGWEMFPNHDIYIWFDASMSLQNDFSVGWLLNQLRDNDVAFFKHPWRKTIKEEVDHVEEYLQKGNEYIVSRYKNGLHKEMYEVVREDADYIDDLLLASTVFVYRNTPAVQDAMASWWYYQSRYYTVDQIALTYVMKKFQKELKLNLKVIDEDIFHCPYISLVSKHH